MFYMLSCGVKAGNFSIQQFLIQLTYRSTRSIILFSIVIAIGLLLWLYTPGGLFLHVYTQTD